MRTLELTDIGGQLFIHGIHVFFRHRHVIRRVILPFLCFPNLPDVDLEISVIADDVSVYFDEIFLVIICDALGIGVPDFSVEDARLILQQQVVIRFPVPCLCGTLSFAQVYVPYRLAFM